VTHTCNPSYSGGRDQEDHDSKSVQAKSSRNCILKKTHHKKKKKKERKKEKKQKEAQGAGCEFRPQYHKKKKKKQRKEIKRSHLAVPKCLFLNDLSSQVTVTTLLKHT
jgi:hypothetical protein